MNPKEITLLVWDDPNNFYSSKTQMSLGNNQLYTLKQFYSNDEFEIVLKGVEDNTPLVISCHINYENFESYFNFINSSIKDDYNIAHFVHYVSSGDSGEAMKKLSDEHGIKERIIKYYDLKQGIKANDIKPFYKKDIISSPLKTTSDISLSTLKQQLPQCDYAIITALEEDEMEKVLPMITKDARVPNEKHLIEYGHITARPEKKIAYASQQTTGMVDAAILATELITLFRPKFLIMAGVLGGKPKDVKLGDVVIATKVFTTDKGKISDLGFQLELETTNNVGSHISALMRAKKDITLYLRKEDQTRESKIDLHFGSIACLRQVISLDGYFESEITSVDRKALALEMESYGVSRACELVNDGKTKALIIKSAMDNTEGKTDKEKPYAAWSSAKFIQYILENDLI